MYTVYILKDSSGKFYKGYTSNLEQRIKDHRRKHTITTSKMDGLTVVYSESCATLVDALKREKYFKSAAGRRYIKFKLKL